MKTTIERNKPITYERLPPGCLFQPFNCLRLYAKIDDSTALKLAETEKGYFYEGYVSSFKKDERVWAVQELSVKV